MSKFLVLFIQMLLIVICINVLNIDSVKLNKTERNHRKMFKFHVDTKGRLKSKFVNDVTSLFNNNNNNKLKRDVNRKIKLLANKRKIQELLKVRNFLEALDRHVRSARLKHYAEYIQVKNETSRRKKSITRKLSRCATESCNLASNSTIALPNNNRINQTNSTDNSAKSTDNNVQTSTIPAVVPQNNQLMLPYNWLQSPHLDWQNPIGTFNKYLPLVPINQPQNYYLNPQQPVDQIAVQMPLVNQQAPSYPLLNYGNINPDSALAETHIQSNYPINTRYSAPLDAPIVDDYQYKQVPNLREVRPEVACEEPPTKSSEIITNNNTLPATTATEITLTIVNSTNVTVNSTTPKTNVTIDNTTPINGSIESIMKKVLEDVEELKTGKAGMLKEDLPCEINGKWFSTAGGLILELCPDNQTNIRITTLDATPKSQHGFMLEDKYQFDGIVPFPRTGMILINGIAQEHKYLATFIGQCLICNGAENIVGQWLTTRKAKNCIDLKASQEIIGDVMIKEHLTQTRNKRYELHANDSTSND